MPQRLSLRERASKRRSRERGSEGGSEGARERGSELPRQQARSEGASACAEDFTASSPSSDAQVVNAAARRIARRRAGSVLRSTSEGLRKSAAPSAPWYFCAHSGLIRASARCDPHRRARPPIGLQNGQTNRDFFLRPA